MNVPFDWKCHPFAEKLLLLHIAMSKGPEGARGVPTRHYSDLARVFANSEEVRNALADGSIQRLAREAAGISNAYFKAGIDIDSLVLRDSPALAPSTEQLEALRASYDRREERAMYYKDRIPFDELMEQVRLIRAAL